MPLTHDPARLAAIGPDACRECHPNEVLEWRHSHHALANRPLDERIDGPRFAEPRPLRDGNMETLFYRTEEGFFIRVNEADGSVTEAELKGVLAYDPLQQYLAQFERGKLQVTSAAYDPAEDEWFEVYAGEDRLPGEWGHWIGRGMNWNANCAYCHMTEFDQGYDEIGDIYHSRWLQHGIACAQCHTGLEEHVATATLSDVGVAPRALTTVQQIDSCKTCHSHREQLTPDTFRPGDRYHDHFTLSLPDQPGLYFPDGQILDEVFVTASFEMSTMGHAGVTCFDCHNPHSLELTQPVANNMVCLQCHGSGKDGASMIEPLSHSRHPVGSTGFQCVECHMPHTVYMQRDPRRDHGFHSPDPLLTRELNIPNACSNCHQEEGLDWVIDHAEDWYGEALAQSNQRRRARLLHAIYEGANDRETGMRLLAEAQQEEIDAWRATMVGLMGPFLEMPEIRAYLQTAAGDPSPHVRTRVATVMSQVGLPEENAVMTALLEDDSRSVRLRAARFMDPGAVAGGALAAEWEDYLRFNADRVGVAFLLAERRRSQGRLPEARRMIRRAVELDRLSPGVYREAAILFSRLGDLAEAGQTLSAGLRVDPRDPGLLYSLALVRSEEGRAGEAVRLLRETVEVDPQFYRAWYNLAVALARAGELEAARNALRRSSPGISPIELQQMENYLRQIEASR